MRTIKQVLIIALVVLLAANIATIIYQGTTDTTEPPVISCPDGVLEVSASVSEAELLADVTASDGQDGDLTAHVIVASISKLISEDTAKVTYYVFDSDDNMASYVRRIRYTDYRKPRFEVKEPLTYTVSEEIELLNRLAANDVVDGDVSDQIRVSTLEAMARNLGLWQGYGRHGGADPSGAAAGLGSSAAGGVAEQISGLRESGSGF